MTDMPNINEVVKDIEDRYGIHLMKDGDYYKTKIKGIEYSFRVGQFSESAVYGGEYYISVGTENRKEMSGTGRPCRNIEEVFDELQRHGLKPVETAQMRLF